MSEALVGWKPKSGNPRVASARIRCLDPLAALRAQGRPVERFRAHHRRDYRVLVLQKLYDREHQELAASLKARGCRIVLDLCDHPFYNPEDTAKLAADAADLRAMLELADVVTVPSEALGRQLPCPSVVIRDGIAPPPAWSQVARKWLGRRRSPFIEVAWYGLAGSSRAPSGMRDLLRISDALTARSSEVPLRLTVLSNSRRLYDQVVRPLSFPTRYVEWGSYGRFCAHFPPHDLCVIPVDNNPYTLCKSNNRLALALYLGVPVIADSIPSYAEFAPYTVLDDWERGFDRYLPSSGYRKQDAEAGRAYVESRYLVRHAAAEWWQLFQQLLEG